MRHNIVEGEPGIFPDPIARLFVAFSRFLRRRVAPNVEPSPEPRSGSTPPEGGEMSLTMTVEERESFLAEVHVGVLGVALPDEAPLTVPIWYSYARGGTVNVITGRSSRKARAIERAGRFSLCAQTEIAPYKYVSVDGPVATTDPSVQLQERRAMAHRYLGPEVGEMYLASTHDEVADSVVIRMTPERWRTTDYGKLFAV
jgi:nitroimidazol reductase NimA-like FMN-containing flavoprotein (pyridoxamine 5'-phosphate oxidase superfamily)